MPITFENENEVIVYALERIIDYARRTQQIFVPQCVWWLATITSLKQGLILHIDNLRKRKAGEIPEGCSGNICSDRAQRIASEEAVSPAPRGFKEDKRQDRILNECEEFLRDSKRLRNIARLKKSGKTKTGRIYPSKASRKSLKIAKNEIREDHSKTDGIDTSEIQRRRS
jgi:hypothetical protein